MLGRVEPSSDVWALRAHPAVWALILGLIGGYWYFVRRIAPAAGEQVTRRQIRSFVVGIALVWVVSDWPMHDLSDTYLYSAHMLQHMTLAYFAPPLLLLAVPTWMARLVLGEGRMRAAIGFLSKPVIAGVIFNAWAMLTHVPSIVNAATTNLPLHYSLHLVLVVSALLMWMPVCGPIPEWRLGAAGTMMYLFAQSIVPTVPAGWLTFAEGAVYKTYDHSVRVFGLSVTYDQQIAGAIMKSGGSVFLWAIVTTIFFSRFMVREGKAQQYRKVADLEAPEFEPLTFEQVSATFERTPSVADPHG